MPLQSRYDEAIWPNSAISLFQVFDSPVSDRTFERIFSRERFPDFANDDSRAFESYGIRIGANS